MEPATLEQRIELFLKAADSIAQDYWNRMKFTFGAAPTHRADFISDKWVKIVNLEERNGVKTVTSVYAFICLQDGQTKSLGTLKKGDIHKPATFKAPAKHARGNVFNEDFAKCLNEHGPVYLR